MANAEGLRALHVLGSASTVGGSENERWMSGSLTVSIWLWSRRTAGENESSGRSQRSHVAVRLHASSWWSSSFVVGYRVESGLIREV